MPDMPIGPGPSLGNDRLQALRQNPQVLAGVSTPRKIRIDLLLGAIGILFVIGFVFLVLDSPSPEMTTATSIAAQQEETGGLMKVGDALIAISLEEGAFPPDVSVGDQVRIIVTSNTDGTEIARSLDTETIVQSIRETSAVGGRFVVTVSGIESVAEEVAASGPVHLALIRKAQ